MAGKAETSADKLARMRAARPRGEGAQSAPVAAADLSHQSDTAPALRLEADKKATLRSTVDLTSQMHYDLERWSQEAGQALGRARIARTDVFKELVRQLLTDQALSERVITQIGARVSRH